MLTKAAAIYIRVSTDAQYEEGYSIEAQKEQLTAYCIAKGIKNYKYYEDGGWSGSNLDRPAMQSLIQDIKRKKISHVLVYKLDRLSRSQKDTLYLIEDVFNPYHVDFISLNESMDTSTPMGRLMLGILSAFAQLERENIKQRTRMGMQARIKEGYWMGGGRIPFGYDYDKDQGILVPNEDADTVRKIYDLYIRGYSSQKIADLLGLKYDRLAIQILKRKSNYGIIEYNGIEYPGKHQPLISKETYDTAMSLMAKRSVNRTSSSEHLLSGLVYCGYCGAKMRYQPWGKNGEKFVCYSQQKSKPYLVKDPNCIQEKIWCREVEDLVIQTIFSLKEKEHTLTPESTQTTTLSMLEQKKCTLERKLIKLYNLYASSEDELLLSTINSNKADLEKINKRILIESDKENLLREHAKIKKAVETLDQRWPHMSPKEHQETIRLLVERITITGTHIEIKLTI